MQEWVGGWGTVEEGVKVPYSSNYNPPPYPQLLIQQSSTTKDQLNRINHLGLRLRESQRPHNLLAY